MNGDPGERPSDWRELAQQFGAITNMDVNLATEILAANGWNLERAVSLFLDEGTTPSFPVEPPTLEPATFSIQNQPGAGQLVPYQQEPPIQPQSPPPALHDLRRRLTPYSDKGERESDEGTIMDSGRCWNCGAETKNKVQDTNTWICADSECWNKYQSSHGTQHYCTLLKIPDPRGDGFAPSPHSFSVAQFNILAGALGTTEHFGYVKPEILAWERRRQVLLEEIQAMVFSSANLDILCLEELDNYWTFFQPHLASMGFRSVYIKRPSLHSTSWSGKDKSDGCGIFFRDAVYELVEEKSVNYEDETDRVGAIVLLRKRRDQRQLLLVGATHLYWDSTKVQTQLKQLQEFEQALLSFRKLMCHRWKQMDIPVIICGDFNNGPGSEVYCYMTHQFMRDQHLHMRSAYDVYQRMRQSSHKQSAESYEEFWRKCNSLRRSGSSVGLFADDPEANDTIASVINGHSEPQFTTFNYKRRWTIDYIFYSCNSLRATHLMEIPKEELLQSDDGPEGWIQRENQRRRKKHCTEAPTSTTSSSSSSSSVSLRRSGSGTTLSRTGSFTSLSSLSSTSTVSTVLDEREELDERANHNGIPNSRFGSDHLPILAVFEFVNDDTLLD